MPCLLGCLAYFFPRLVIVLVWIFSHYFDVYQTRIWPFLGFLFMPLTTLAYALAIHANGSVTGFYAFIVILAALCDLGTHGVGPMAKKVQQQRQ